MTGGGRRMAGVSAVLLGAGFGLYLFALRRLLEALFWPKVGGSLLLCALLGGALGGVAAYAWPRGRRGVFPLEAWFHLSWSAAALATLPLLGWTASTIWPGKGVSLSTFPLHFMVALALPPLLAVLALSASRRRGDVAAAPGWALAGAGAALLLVDLLPPASIPPLAVTGAALGVLPSLGGGGRAPGLRRLAGAALLVLALFLALPPPVVDFRSTRIPAAGDTPAAGGHLQRWGRLSRLDFQRSDEEGVRLIVDGGLREDLIGEIRGANLVLPVRKPKGEERRVLFIGFPSGPILLPLLEKPRTRITLLEPDPVLREEVLHRWPALARAADDGRVVFAGGNSRAFLYRDETRYDLIVLTDATSFKAYLSWSLNFTRDYLFTVEAFRAYLDHLAPRGLFFVQRIGMGRVVTTLREALEPITPEEFGEKIVILGEEGHLISQCYYRPEGFSDRDNQRLVNEVRKKRHRLLYHPGGKRKRNFYFSLARGRNVRGYYFSTALDLSPARDARPYFNHLERLMISPTADPLPEEMEQFHVRWVLQFIPGGDWDYLLVIIAGLILLLPAAGVPLAVLHHRSFLARHARPCVPFLVFLGASAGLVPGGFVALAGWINPWPAHPGWPLGLLLAAGGAGWRIGRGRDRGHLDLVLTALLLLLSIGVYRAGGPLLAAGSAAAAASVAGTAIVLGTLSGMVLRISIVQVDEVFAGALPWAVGLVLLGAVASMAAGELLAVTFGLPLVWLLAATGLLAARRAGRSL